MINIMTNEKISFFQYDRSVYSELSKKNIEFNTPPQKSPDGLVKVTFCKDPDGTPIELVEMLNIT